MKTLANTSPFLLLLVPVFIMILLTFTKAEPNSQTEDVVSKMPTAQNGFIKISIPFSR